MELVPVSGDPFAKNGQGAQLVPVNFNPFTAPQQDFSFKPERDMSTAELVLAGVGKAVTDILQGAGQTLGIADRAEVAEKRKLDAPLMGTTSGKVGNFLGNVATTILAAMIPGANTMAGSAAIGAGMGLMQPSTSTGETLANIASGGAGGAVGQAVANKAGQLASNLLGDKKAAFVTRELADQQKMEAARLGAKSGYVVPPADLQPGAMTEALSGLSGKIKTAQVASARNQSVTDRLAREAIGLQEGDVLTNDILQGIRNQAAQAYAPVKSAGLVQADKQFAADLAKIESTYQSAGSAFPGLAKNEIGDLVSSLRQPSFDAGGAVDAVKVLRETADKAFRTGDKGLGKAAKEAASALEDQLDRHLAAQGNTDALQALRDARQVIAKTYSVQKALNEQTGNVSAHSLAKELAKGRPLSGELKTIAQVGQAFPKATQALKEAPKAFSPLDFAVGGIGGLTNPMAALTMAARPLARNALLSPSVQQRALQQEVFSPGLLGLLSSDKARALGGPALAGGLLAIEGP